MRLLGAILPTDSTVAPRGRAGRGGSGRGVASSSSGTTSAVRPRGASSEALKAESAIRARTRPRRRGSDSRARSHAGGQLGVGVAQQIARRDVVVADGQRTRRAQGGVDGRAPHRVVQHHGPGAQEVRPAGVEAPDAPGERRVHVLGHDLAGVAPPLQQALPGERLVGDRVAGGGGRDDLGDGGHGASRPATSAKRALTAGQP